MDIVEVCRSWEGKDGEEAKNRRRTGSVGFGTTILEINCLASAEHQHCPEFD